MAPHKDDPADVHLQMWSNLQTPPPPRRTRWPPQPPLATHLLHRRPRRKGHCRMPILKDEITFIILGHLLLGLIIGAALS